MSITPAILVPTYKELDKQIKQVNSLFKYVQLDIMDGFFVSSKSFDYNEPDENLRQYFNNNLNTNLEFELHLMTQDPLTEIAKWEKIKNVFRVIFHVESDCNPNEVVNKIRANCWQVGIAINPDTPLSKIEPYLDLINLILFMTVVPGKQGGEFVPKVGEKIKQISTLSNKPIVAVDGSVNKDTISQIDSWGVDIFNVGSALMGQKDIKKAHEELKSFLNK